jgi:hypothetical protein
VRSNEFVPRTELGDGLLEVGRVTVGQGVSVMLRSIRSMPWRAR